MSGIHYFCPLCLNPYVFKNYSLMFKHIREEHREDPSFQIRCELSVFCGSRYLTYNSYRQHIYRCHRSLLDFFDDNDDITLQNINDITDELEDFSFDPLFDTQSDLIDNPDLLIYPEDFSEMDHKFFNFNPSTNPVANEHITFNTIAEFYTRFLLELREYHLLPQKIVQLISFYISTLLDMTVKLIKSKTSTSAVISTNDLDIAFIHINSIINSISKSEYQFLKQCAKYFKYDAPTKIILNTNDQQAYYIPLKQSLGSMLQNEQLLKSIIDNINALSLNTANDQDLILSNRQGRSIISNMSRQVNKNVLLLKLYTDGISITNPLGAKRDCHKLTCFYYLLDDMPNIIRSKVNSIGLFCMCYTKYLNDQNNVQILMDVLVNDLNMLQDEGITIACPSSRIYFVFSTVCADNLAANEVGGFQKTFSSGSFCRHCYITYEQRLIPLTDLSFVPRTKLRHDIVLNQIISNNNDQAIKGIKCNSWFKNLIGFHPTESLPPDLMHNVAEGLCPLIISALLKEAVQKNILSYAAIEQRTSDFSFGFNDLSNKPPPIKKQHLSKSNIIGTASQKLCLFKFLPFIFYDVIDDLSLFSLYTLLREIISYLYADVIRKSWVPYIDALCKSFHSLMVERLPDHVTPKVHFLTEYCRSIENHGLPVLNTCIRFESKHQYFKQIASHGLNFKNPLLTMFKRHQLRQCLLNKIESSQFSPSIIVHAFKSVDISKFSPPIQRLLKKDIAETEQIRESSSVYYHDLNIKQKSVFVHDLIHTEEIPAFCQIHHLLRIKEKWFAIAEQLHTNSFNEHLWAYEVEYTGTLVKIDVEHCLDIFSECLDIYEIEETYYINMLTHEDIDGATLVLLQHDDIMKIFPRLRDRVKFVDQRTKLIEKLKECLIDADEFTDAPHPNGSPHSPVLITTEVNQNDDVCDDTSSNIDCHDNYDNHVESRLPTDYTGPILSSRIQYFIDQNNISKFNPHTTLRAEILSLIFDHVAKTHNLLYPNHDEYMIMAKSIVQKLPIPSGLVCGATKEWLESIKQKFKRERRPLQVENKLVKKKKDTYGNGKTNGRPKKKSVAVQAERRTNHVPFINLNDNHDENLSSLINQMNIELHKDDPDTDVLHHIWRKSFNIRRLHVRQLPADELLSRFPGYGRSDLLLAEVQETAGVDLVQNIKDILPKFFDCIPDNNCFLSDVLPIRVIRLLCKKFGDPVGNVFTHDEVLVSYPCIKILDQKFELYLDFHLITETDSCSTALALLLSLYYVFEIRFASHNRCCRLLYSILFEDTHHLNKSLKKLLNDWNYKIINRPLINRQALVMNITDSFTQPSADNENVLSSSNNLTQIDHLTRRQSQEVRSCSSPLKEITLKNIQHHLSRSHENDNDNDQQSDADDENTFNHLSNVPIPVIDSKLNSPMTPQNESQTSINNPALTDDFYVSQTDELYSSKNALIEKENRIHYAPTKEQTKPSINLKRKCKQDRVTPSSIFPKQSTRIATKRTRVK